MTPRTPRRAISPAALAVAWQVSTKTVYRLINSGELQAVRIGGQLRIPTHEVDRFEQRQKV